MKCGDLKPLLIDLEACDEATGGKQVIDTVQPERLSGEGVKYCVYWIHTVDHSNIKTEGYVGITKDFKERMKAHRKNLKTSTLFHAIHKYGWSNLVKEIIHSDLTLDQALHIENELRPVEAIGWNLQRGGFLGVNPEWYDLEENRNSHSNATSIATKKAIAEKDTKEARALRTMNAHKRGAYKDCALGSKNPRSILTESDVIDIKYNLIPSGLSNTEIAKLYNVKHYVISFIRSGKNWSHI